MYSVIQRRYCTLSYTCPVAGSSHIIESMSSFKQDLLVTPESNEIGGVGLLVLEKIDWHILSPIESSDCELHTHGREWYPPLAAALLKMKQTTARTKFVSPSHKYDSCSTRYSKAATSNPITSAH